MNDKTKTFFISLAVVAVAAIAIFLGYVTFQFQLGMAK